MITIAWTENTTMEVINFLVTHIFLLWSTDKKMATDLEQVEEEYMMTGFSFLGELSF